MLRATDDTVVITIRGIGDMTPRNPDSFIDLSTVDTDFDRPKAVVPWAMPRRTRSNSPAAPRPTLIARPGTTWMRSDKIALIFAGDEPFEILAGNTVISVPAGTLPALCGARRFQKPP